MKSSLLVLIFALVTVNSHAQNKKAKVDNTIYTAVEEPALFPGGEAALGKFIQQNMKYPKLTEKDDLYNSRVFISFIVEKSGALSNIKIIRGGQNKLTDEALRVIKLSPKWTPGKMHGKAVRTSFTVPITICLGDF